MKPPEIREKFIAILDSILAIEPDKVKLESDIIRDLHADSLDVVEIVIECELEFAVDIPDEDAEKLKTVKEWPSFLWRLASKAFSTVGRKLVSKVIGASVLTLRRFVLVASRRRILTTDG